MNHKQFFISVFLYQQELNIKMRSTYSNSNKTGSYSPKNATKNFHLRSKKISSANSKFVQKHRKQSSFFMTTVTFLAVFLLMLSNVQSAECVNSYTAGYNWEPVGKRSAGEYVLGREQNQVRFTSKSQFSAFASKFK